MMVTRLTSAIVATAALLLAGLASPGAASASTCEQGTVVVLHDVLGNPPSVQRLADAVRTDGWCVETPTYGRNLPPLGRLLPGGLSGLEASADDVERIWADVRARRPGAPVHVVAHGFGSLVALRAAQRDPGAAPDSLVAVAPMWNGTNLLGIGTIEQLSRDLGTYPLVLAIEAPLEDPFCRTCRDLIHGSDALREMQGGPPPAGGVTLADLGLSDLPVTSIATRTDLLVQPWSSGLLADGTNVVLQDHARLSLANHWTMPHHPTVHALVREALRAPVRSRD